MNVCLRAYRHMYSHTHVVVRGKGSKTRSFMFGFCPHREWGNLEGLCTWALYGKIDLGKCLESCGIHIESTYVLVSSDEA